MSRTTAVFVVLTMLAVPCAVHAASEMALYYLPNARVEYEGTGFRQFDQGWELKVKPQSSGAGLRWRQQISDGWATQIQYWRNAPFYAMEDGNSLSQSFRQTGQTRLSLQNLMWDARTPLFESRVEAVAGGQWVHESFHRKSVIFNQAPEPAEAHETLDAWGGYMGFHWGRAFSHFYYDGEAVMTHFFHTNNRLSVGGGSIRQRGYGYAIRLEGGWRSGPWRVGLGWVRQLYQIHAPGGQSFPSGAAASLPLNKTDFFSPFLTVTYAY